MNKQKLKELYKLIEENPECEVLFFANSDILIGDYDYGSCDIFKIEKELTYFNEECYIPHYCFGEIDIKEAIEENIDVMEKDVDVSEEYNNLIKEGKIKETINVYLDV